MAKRDSGTIIDDARQRDEARQHELFGTQERSRAADELLVLHALGDFQKRGKLLADRDLPIDRLRGALRREAARAETSELNDERFAEVLGALGAHVKRVPAFIAKHPFRVTVPASLAEHALAALAERDASD